MTEHLARAARFVRRAFPDTPAAFLGGSAAAGRSTATSDLDIVVLLDPPAHAFRDTTRFEGTLVEVFAHTERSLWWFVDRETLVRRSPLLHMVAGGVVLVDRDGLAARLRAEAARRWARGPAPLSPDELDDRRYAVSDLVDDLAGGGEPDELVFVGGRLAVQLAELALLRDGHWVGNGKWLPRRLRAADPVTGRRLAEAYRRLAADGDPASLLALADDLLATVGGRLMEGYRRQAPD